MLDWNQLLIRTDTPDVSEMLRDWEWLIGTDKHPLVMTKFGDWFLADPEGHVLWLDVMSGTCKQVAESVSEFGPMMIRTENLDHWFFLPWCYRLHREGMIPGPGQCFGFKVPPKLGAPIDLSNVEVANLRAYQFWMSDIGKIPPGTTVDAITVNGKIP
jgi:hypothetical protein